MGRKPGPPSVDEIAAANALWAVKLSGQFAKWETHYLPCPSRENAVARAGFWRNYRWDVAVDVCTRVLGEPWRTYREPVTDAYAEDVLAVAA